MATTRMPTRVDACRSAGSGISIPLGAKTLIRMDRRHIRLVLNGNKSLDTGSLHPKMFKEASSKIQMVPTDYNFVDVTPLLKE